MHRVDEGSPLEAEACFFCEETLYQRANILSLATWSREVLLADFRPNACRDRRAYSQSEITRRARRLPHRSSGSPQISRARGLSIARSGNSTFRTCGSAKASEARIQLLIGHSPARTRGFGISLRACTKCFTDGLIRQAYCLAASPWGARHHTDNFSPTTTLHHSRRIQR